MKLFKRGNKSSKKKENPLRDFDNAVKTIDKNIAKLEHPSFRKPRTIGQKAADILTKWAGSWTFIITLGVFLAIWMTINTVWIIFGQKWDPYPFILLNFILSTLAAVQAPIILMSQNRQAQKDRARAEYDYQVNKKAEREIQAIKRQLNRIEDNLGKKKK